MHLEQAPSIRASKSSYGTVAVVDMVGYSTLARMLEENMGASAVADLNRQIQEFVQSALSHLDDPSACTKIAETGDGVILLFDSAHDAHVFAEHMHLNAAKHNRSRNDASAKRWFRIGIATGELNREKLIAEKEKYAGITIANAGRLEAAAEAGEIVMDMETFAILPREDRISYGPEGTARGKREEVFTVRRYKVVNSTHSPEQDTKHTSRAKLFGLGSVHWTLALTVATILLEPLYGDRVVHFMHSLFSSNDVPVLQSIQAKPNLVKVGDILTITVGIDRPAPKNGVKITLISDDQSILNVDGNATVYQGSTSGTAYSRVVAVPNYLYPINIAATYNGDTVRTSVSVAGQRNPSPQPQPTTERRQKESTSPNTTPDSVAKQPPPIAPAKPAPLSSELLSRLEDSQGRLSGELGYWQTMKTQMPPGTSLRPEITSQIYAAKSTSQRCSDEAKASDATSLGPCIDSLNDHLNQLKIQH